MKKTMFAALAFALATFGAQAAPQSTTAAETEEIQVSTANELATAISFLGQKHDEVIGKDSNQKVIAVPYFFAPETLWAFADNLTALRKLLTTYEENRKSLVTQAEAKNGGPLRPKEEAKFDQNNNMTKAEVKSSAQLDLEAAVQKVYESKRQVAKLFRIKRADLCLGGKTNSSECPKDTANQIAPGIISTLDFIIER